MLKGHLMAPALFLACFLKCVFSPLVKRGKDFESIQVCPLTRGLVCARAGSVVMWVGLLQHFTVDWCMTTMTISSKRGVQWWVNQFYIMNYWRLFAYKREKVHWVRDGGCLCNQLGLQRNSLWKIRRQFASAPPGSGYWFKLQESDPG